MRKIYKFSHSISQGGYLYAHKTEGQIKNKTGLKNCLAAISKKLGLIDATIKVYDSIFFFFYMCKPSLTPADLTSLIQKQIGLFGQWDEQYLYTGIYDLSEEYITKYLKDAGFEYEKGI